MDERDKVSLWVKFPVEGWGTIEDLGFRHRLEDALTELLERHQLGTWQGSGQGGGQQDVSYSVPTARLEAAWDLVRAKLTELGVLQRATVEVYRTMTTDHPSSCGPIATCPSPSRRTCPPAGLTVGDDHKSVPGNNLVGHARRAPSARRCLRCCPG